MDERYVVYYKKKVTAKRLYLKPIGPIKKYEKIQNDEIFFLYSIQRHEHNVKYTLSQIDY